jgi:cytochrome d ubiquinol oxidase subunit II
VIFDYETLKIIWWLFVGVLLVGFALTDGWDLGVGTLLPFVARTDEERRVVINSIGPTWEGNQVWFITAAGATFAAWPLVYAVSFSGMYFAMMLVLFALFFRPVAFDYRDKLPDPRWRAAWDWGIFVGSFVPALVFGVAFGNLLQGVPFHFDASMRSYYTGSFLALLNPFALLAGVISVSMLVLHGSAYLQIRSTGAINARAVQATLWSAAVLIASFGAAGWLIARGIDGYRITAMPSAGLASTPLGKTVTVATGEWLANYALHPWTMLAPALGFAGAISAIILSSAHRAGMALVASGLAVAGIILTAGFSMFPFVMPSSSSPNSSLTVWDAVSSHLTLNILFVVVVVLLPIVICYTAWAYRVMRGTITAASLRENEHGMY